MWAANCASPSLPGARWGKRAARLCSSANARGPSKASGASVEVSGVARPLSENPAIATASRTGTKPAR